MRDKEGISLYMYYRGQLQIMNYELRTARSAKLITKPGSGYGAAWRGVPGEARNAGWVRASTGSTTHHDQSPTTFFLQLTTNN